MKSVKKEAKAKMISRYQAEARLKLSKRSERQARLLGIALSKGQALEPVGRMAG
jgi:hypothetical protein